MTIVHALLSARYRSRSSRSHHYPFVALPTVDSFHGLPFRQPQRPITLSLYKIHTVNRSTIIPFDTHPVSIPTRPLAIRFHSLALLPSFPLPGFSLFLLVGRLLGLSPPAEWCSFSARPGGGQVTHILDSPSDFHSSPEHVVTNRAFQ